MGVGDDDKGEPNYFLLSLSFTVFKVYRGSLSTRSVEGQVWNWHLLCFKVIHGGLAFLEEITPSAGRGQKMN